MHMFTCTCTHKQKQAGRQAGRHARAHTSQTRQAGMHVHTHIGANNQFRLPNGGELVQGTNHVSVNANSYKDHVKYRG